MSPKLSGRSTSTRRDREKSRARARFRRTRGNYCCSVNPGSQPSAQIEPPDVSVKRDPAAQRRGGRLSAKIKETVGDDRRLNRYYVRDVVAPRFFLASLDDYVRSVSERDWAAAKRSAADVKHFASLHHDRRALAWKVRMIGGPRRFRYLLRINERLPRQLRPTSNPLLRIR